ncbi:hypothetical protein G5S93_13260 [Legionella pneumophila serogroup 1]|uniref:competence protein CoiA family protein n=1 Tax=Legionella pneumophila TaxID=446 RepID=UPI001021FD4D|nr:competence protein CoiA family protein [Legionella pneumophila]HAT9682592.1 hypothetical protein [Legionella pneumophila subsp. pneumophila]MCH9100154.1 hypothetical protein [Legionella pneumophila serogroup 1]MCH9112289.1 hypothetical protein [Legionella pneumophila serogroup 1]MDW9159564.1 competence protein CoiA family protein [Legionella pneumophila]RYX29861.1 hypothetical protein D7271_13610 [Legionella pneumophila]
MKAVQIKLPFGLNEKNRIVHIADVERDNNDIYICPSCRSPLIAVKGSIKEHHFRHETIKECVGGLESAIHLAAKQIIMERKKITLPKCLAIASAKDSWGIPYRKDKTVVEDGCEVSFDSVHEEINLSGMRVDILANKGNKQLIIEIFYRHLVDDQKIDKIREANISAIEINLSELIPENVKDLEAFWCYINDPKNVRWLYNIKAEESLYPELRKLLEIEILEKEKEYKKKEIPRLKRGLRDLKLDQSRNRIAKYKREAEICPLWKFYSNGLDLSLDNMPNFLNVDVPNGDWIYGCDKRVWQTVFYKHCIYRIGKQFSIMGADAFLKNTCIVPRCVKIIESYAARYPELIPADVAVNMPSTLKTIRAYLDYLCELEMLAFTGNELYQKGDFEYKIISDTPVLERF